MPEISEDIKKQMFDISVKAGLLIQKLAQKFKERPSPEIIHEHVMETFTDDERNFLATTTIISMINSLLVDLEREEEQRKMKKMAEDMINDMGKPDKSPYT